MTNPTNPTTNHPSILRRKQVEARIGLSRASIYKRLNPKETTYDPTFPAPISLGANSVGWLENEISEWIAGRIAASRSPQAAA